ncbi:alpha/beta fold hydrolase [Streptomyces sp. LP05-1]|uniref:Alpha/beta fold hydrolase n=1 Tax=Streptomyces pyxinae TaxID=2970734 RepID=A0ABT2CQR3_9ACTN|nr:thioesterase domain-containing protein [Streptomyces sp. LP05-1]MCS0639775.1 alpha/beta fold hydrolase [Streptomyces sp. LP05-1]
MVLGDPAAAADVVVFLPPAGSVTAPFLALAELLPDTVASVHCEVPGRGRLADETAPGSVTEVVDRWAADLLAVRTGGRLHLFGHSLGALFAHELAVRLARPPGHAVGSLSVSGARDPGSPPRSLVAATFAALRRERPGTDRADDTDGAWLTLDLRLRREHRTAAPGRAPVRVPLALFGGASDPFARPADMAGWRDFTTGPLLGTFTLPGGHDYYRTGPAATATAIARVVRASRDPSPSH